MFEERPLRNLSWNDLVGGGGGGKLSSVPERGTLSDTPSDFHLPSSDRLRVCVPLRLGVRSTLFVSGGATTSSSVELNTRFVT